MARAQGRASPARYWRDSERQRVRWGRRVPWPDSSEGPRSARLVAKPRSHRVEEGPWRFAREIRESLADAPVGEHSLAKPVEITPRTASREIRRKSFALSPCVSDASATSTSNSSFRSMATGSLVL